MLLDCQTTLLSLWLCWKALLTISPVCVLMVAANSYPLGCVSPSGMIFERENTNLQEYVPSFLRNLA